ncbi:MAG: 50S ribosomal protein L25, partial [Candidatus Puniceispirillaceae bacterium]
MSDITQIDATMRSRVGKGSARAARRAGKIPAVIYGDKQAPLSIEMEARVVRKVIHEPGIFGRLLNINIDGKDNTVLTRDIQMHPVSDEPLHMDMLRVGASSTVSVAVPVEFINHGLSPGLKIGGVL